jgi:hypothetical protein
LGLRPADHDTPRRALEELLGHSHRLAPGTLNGAVATAAGRLGASDAEIYLVDYEQRVLMPLGDGDEAPVDATVAGRAYRTELLVVITDDDTGSVRAWAPLLDGADRVGVLRLDFPEHPDDGLLDEVSLFASLVAELVVSKSQVGDPLIQARRRRDLDLAAELRWTFLPPLTFCNHQIEIAGILEPAYEIAGDTFDYAINDAVAHVALLDAMGHGLEASRIANLAVATYRHSRRHQLGLLETLRAMDLMVADQFGPERFVTGQLVEVDMATGRTHLVTAGHPRPLLLRGGRLVGEVVCDTSLPIGLGDVEVQAAELSLEPGDRLLFFTDGVVEARSADGEEFGLERLGDLAARAISSEEAPSETVRRLIHSVLAHEAGQLRDDATIVIVGRPGPS